MGENTGIAWCDHTFNPWWGCTKISEGCRNCYAEKWSIRFGRDHWGPGKPRRELGTDYWRTPFLWNARADLTGIRERVFSGSMCDIFDAEAPQIESANLCKLIQRTPSLDWLLLTKRPATAVLRKEFWLPNVWMGTTVENRAAIGRITSLRLVEVPVRFLSCEPLLEDLGELDLRGIHWVIAGAESGPGARPMNEDWVRSIRDQCQAAGVAFFYKQRIENGKKVTLPLLDGRQWAEFPKGGAA
jgi:protein gp37